MTPWPFSWTVSCLTLNQYQNIITPHCLLVCIWLQSPKWNSVPLLLDIWLQSLNTPRSVSYFALYNVPHIFSCGGAGLVSELRHREINGVPGRWRFISCTLHVRVFSNLLKQWRTVFSKVFRSPCRTILHRFKSAFKAVPLLGLMASIQHWFPSCRQVQTAQLSMLVDRTSGRITWLAVLIVGLAVVFLGLKPQVWLTGATAAQSSHVEYTNNGPTGWQKPAACLIPPHFGWFPSIALVPLCYTTFGHRKTE